MAKRFTDTTKWGKASFDGLSDKMKLVWIYLCDNCDHAGIWDVNWGLMSYHLNAPRYELKDSVTRELKDKVAFLSDTKIFLPSFIEFQYGELNPGNRVHLSVINRLKKEGAYKVLTSSMCGAKDKDKEKDKDKDKDKERIFSEKEIYLSLPIATRDLLQKKYDASFIEEGITEALTYHSSDPTLAFWPPMKWGKIITSWLTEKKRREKNNEKKPVVDSFSGVAK